MSSRSQRLMRPALAGALLALGLLTFGCGSDKGTASATGTIAGTVYWAGTTNPVLKAIVVCVDVTDTTDGYGAYRLENVPVGTHTLTASKTNYGIVTTTVRVTGNTRQNIFIPYKGDGGGGGIGE